MSKVTSRSEADRLGKRGSYRLGGFGMPGPGRPDPPPAFRPSFVPPQHRGSALGWLLAAIVGILLIAGGAMLGLWFMPFLLGLATGVAMRWGAWRLRVTIPAVLIMAAAGWTLALWAAAMRSMPVAPTARTIAEVAGLPAVAALIVGITLAVSVVQGLAGLWLGRAIAPRPARG
jgi:hypothetical protein